MQDPILDDAKALLNKELGDKRILEQICRASENNEVISNFERNYVQKLAEKHLGKITPVETSSVEKKLVVPDVVIPEILPQKIETKLESPQITQTKPKNTKIMNYAFEEVNPKFISGIICEFGIFTHKQFLREIKHHYPWLWK